MAEPTQAQRDLASRYLLHDHRVPTEHKRDVVARMIADTRGNGKRSSRFRTKTLTWSQ